MEEKETIELRNELGMVIVKLIKDLDRLEIGSEEWVNASKVLDSHLEEYRKMGEGDDEWAKYTDHKREFYIKTGLTVLSLALSTWGMWYAYQTEHKTIINHRDAVGQAKGVFKNRTDNLINI